MNLLYKPDFAAVKVAWRHFWAREKWKRPLVVASVPRDPAHAVPWTDGPYHLHYHRKTTGDWADYLRRIDRWLENQLWLAEAVPYFDYDFGPDQFAALLGATLKSDPDSPTTNWVEPVIEDWSALAGGKQLMSQNQKFWTLLVWSFQSQQSALLSRGMAAMVLAALPTLLILTLM